MTQTRTYICVGAVVLLVVFAGCMGAAPAAEQSDPTTAPFAGPVLAVTDVPINDVIDAPNSSKAQFGTLTAAYQAEFRSALESDVRNPTSWEDSTDIEYVHYNGTWYSVQVHIVN